MIDVEDIYELAPVPRGMLVHGLRAPQDGAYVEQTLLRLAGPLDGAAFWDAWQLVVDRHPSLRTGVHWRDVRVPVQVVRRGVVLPHEELDWRGAPPAEVERRLRDLLDTERRAGLDLERPPLLRVALVHHGDDAHVVALRMSHLVVDGWSVGVLCGEFVAAYRALAAGRVPVLPPAPPLRPYVERWARRAGDPDELAFWRAETAGWVPPPPVRSADAGEAAGDLPHGLVEVDAGAVAERLDRAARRARVSRHSVVQASWSLVLAAATGRDDVAAGTTFAHRPADVSGVEGVVGCLLATVPVRVHVSDDAPVDDWLAGVQATVQRVRDHLDVPLADVQRVAGTPAGAELVETLVEHMNVPLPAVDLGAHGPRLVGVAMDSRPHVPLSLVVPPGDLPLRLVHDTRRVGAGAARALLEATVRVVDALADAGAHDGRVTVAALRGLLGDVPDLTVPDPAAGSSADAVDGPPEAAPRAGTETEVAAVLAELLDQPALGRGQDLLELGLHSLLGTRVVNRLARRLGVDVPLRVLFERPTVAGLARTVDALLAAAAAPADAPAGAAGGSGT
ncbi:condensation domain-containing protein, partial [Cellulomonas shaoxiangyii]